MSTILSQITTPQTKTQATITILTVVVFVVAYVIWTDFFVNCSVLLAILFPLLVGMYYLSKMLNKSLSVLLAK